MKKVKIKGKSIFRKLEENNQNLKTVKIPFKIKHYSITECIGMRQACKFLPIPHSYVFLKSVIGNKKK